MNSIAQFISQDLFSKVAIASGLISATVAVLTSLIHLLLARYIAKKKLRAAEEKDFQEALESDELLVLGNYLSSSLGRFTIHEYSTDENVRNRVNAMLSRLVEFIGSEDVTPIKRATEQPGFSSVIEDMPDLFPADSESPGKATPKARTFSDAHDSEMARVAKSLEEGEIWDALARLRRVIEVRLRGVALRNGIPLKNLRSAGQVLRVLRDRGLLSNETFESLNRAIGVCNQGIHGIEVPHNEANMAFLTAEEELAKLLTAKVAE
jgi:hypothetical protein